MKPVTGDSTKVALQNASATFEQPEDSGRHPFKKFAIASTISADPPQEIWGWAIAGPVLIFAAVITSARTPR